MKEFLDRLCSDKIETVSGLVMDSGLGVACLGTFVGSLVISWLGLSIILFFSPIFCLNLVNSMFFKR